MRCTVRLRRLRATRLRRKLERDWPYPAWVTFAHRPQGPRYRVVRFDLDGMLLLDGVRRRVAPHRLIVWEGNH